MMGVDDQFCDLKLVKVLKKKATNVKKLLERVCELAG